MKKEDFSTENSVGVSSFSDIEEWQYVFLIGVKNGECFIDDVIFLFAKFFIYCSKPTHFFSAIPFHSVKELRKVSTKGKKTNNKYSCVKNRYVW